MRFIAASLLHNFVKLHDAFNLQLCIVLIECFAAFVAGAVGPVKWQSSPM